MSLMKERYRVLRMLTVRQSGRVWGCLEVRKEDVSAGSWEADQKLPGRVEEEFCKRVAGAGRQSWERAERRSEETVSHCVWSSGRKWRVKGNRAKWGEKYGGICCYWFVCFPKHPDRHSFQEFWNVHFFILSTDTDSILSMPLFRCRGNTINKADPAPNPQALP